MRGGTARTHRRGDHRDTLSSRNNLAGAYQSAGDLGRAIPLYEQTLADRQRVLAEQAEFWLYEDEYDTSLRIRLWDLPSTGYEAISTVAAEAGLRRNKLTHKHTGLKDLFYALVRGRDPLPETVPESARARADKQQQDLTRIRAERDDLRSQAQLLARIVQVLEIENHQLKEANTNLRGQVAAQGAVRDLTRRRRT